MDASNQVSFPNKYQHLRNFDWKTEKSMGQLNSALNGRHVIHEKLEDTMENADAKVLIPSLLGGFGLLVVLVPLIIYGAQGFPRVTQIPLIVFESVGGTLTLGSAIAAGIYGKKLHRLRTELLTEEQIKPYRDTVIHGITAKVLANTQEMSTLLIDSARAIELLNENCALLAVIDHLLQSKQN